MSLWRGKVPPGLWRPAKTLDQQPVLISFGRHRQLGGVLLLTRLADLGGGGSAEASILAAVLAHHAGDAPEPLLCSWGRVPGPSGEISGLVVFGPTPGPGVCAAGVLSCSQHPAPTSFAELFGPAPADPAVSLSTRRVTASRGPLLEPIEAIRAALVELTAGRSESPILRVAGQ